MSKHDKRIFATVSNDTLPMHPSPFKKLPKGKLIYKGSTNWSPDFSRYRPDRLVWEITDNKMKVYYLDPPINKEREV